MVQEQRSVIIVMGQDGLNARADMEVGNCDDYIGGYFLGGL